MQVGRFSAQRERKGQRRSRAGRRAEEKVAGAVSRPANACQSFQCAAMLACDGLGSGREQSCGGRRGFERGSSSRRGAAARGPCRAFHGHFHCSRQRAPRCLRGVPSCRWGNTRQRAAVPSSTAASGCGRPHLRVAGPLAAERLLAREPWQPPGGCSSQWRSADQPTLARRCEK